MVKLFAWEQFIHKKLGDVREEEIKQIRYKRFLEIGIAFISEMLPLLAKIVVFAVYVSFEILSYANNISNVPHTPDLSYEARTHGVSRIPGSYGLPISFINQFRTNKIKTMNSGLQYIRK